MAIDRIYVGVGPGETRVALCDGDRLVDLLIERDGEAGYSGDIHLGRVMTVAAGLGAAFVDIGLDRPGFLPLAAAGPAVSEGDPVVVQVAQEAIGDKGAKLTREVSLAGRYLAYAPGQGGVWLSKRIDGDAERHRLTAAMKNLAGPGEGIVLRTFAAGVDESRLRRDLDGLRRLWQGIEARRPVARAPACLHREADAVRRALRDDVEGPLAELVADDADTLAGLRVYCQALVPEFLPALRLHAGPDDLFESAGIEAQIDAALDPRVPLASGGEIVIESMAALTAIDVNSAQASGQPRQRQALAVNLEAAAAIGQQLRLRNVAGMVLCDMLPLRDRRQGAQVLTALETATADDPVPVRVAGFTRLGLIELVRERHRAPLAEWLLSPASGTPLRAPLAVAFAALRAVLAAVRRSPGLPPRLVAAPAVVQALSGPAAAALARAEAAIGAAIVIECDVALGVDQFRLEGGRR